LRTAFSGGTPHLRVNPREFDEGAAEHFRERVFRTVEWFAGISQKYSRRDQMRGQFLSKHAVMSEIKNSGNLWNL
jgi:hypothetical protein